MTLLKVPAKHRIFYFFLTETFLSLVVIFINKSYQQFAIKGRVHIILHCYLMNLFQVGRLLVIIINYRTVHKVQFAMDQLL